METWKILKHRAGILAYKWDGENMRITNFEPANQFVKREYRKGWGELKFKKLERKSFDKKFVR